MNEQFKATHVIVATSYEGGDELELNVGAKVMMYDDHLWINSIGRFIHNHWVIVEPIQPASLFTEAQLRELEGLYGLVPKGTVLTHTVRVGAYEADIEAHKDLVDSLSDQIVTISDGVAKDGDVVWWKSVNGPVQFVFSKSVGAWEDAKQYPHLYSFAQPKGKFVYE